MQHQTYIQDDNCSIGEDSCIDLWADIDQRNRGIRSGSIDSSRSISKVETSQPPVRDLQIERQDDSKCEVPCYVNGRRSSLSNSFSSIESSKDATYVLPPVIASPMERMQRRLSASSHARTSQVNSTSNVPLISSRSDHSARSGLQYTNAPISQGHPRRDVSVISTESGAHSPHRGLRSTHSCETNKAHRDTQFDRRMEPLRRHNMTDAQIRTYERIERYKALEAQQSTASPIPGDSQSAFPTDNTHLRRLPFGYDSPSMDNRGDMRRQNGISKNADSRLRRAGIDLQANVVRGSPERVWCREDAPAANFRGSADRASRRDLSTKDDLLVNFRSKSPPPSAEQSLKNLFRPLSRGVANMMNGTNQDGPRDMAFARQSRSSRSLDEPGAEKKGCPPSVRTMRNKSIPQHSGSNRSY